MQKIFIISDTHFGHKNVIEYCNRPFKTIKDMNDKIIENWNNVVSPNDLVYHLGDFGFGNRTEVNEFRKRLNGDIILIKGNHDRRGNESFLNAGFKEVYSGETNIVYKNIPLWLTHRPHNETTLLNIHGHVHNDINHNIDNPHCFNVSVENIGYTPIPLDAVLEEFKKRGLIK